MCSIPECLDRAACEVFVQDRVFRVDPSELKEKEFSQKVPPPPAEEAMVRRRWFSPPCRPDWPAS